MDKITPVTSAVLAVLIVLGLVVLIALGQPVPTELWAAFGTVLGFFFGTSTKAAKA
jgi:hypothetical protein